MDDSKSFSAVAVSARAASTRREGNFGLGNLRLGGGGALGGSCSVVVMMLSNVFGWSHRDYASQKLNRKKDLAKQNNHQNG
jgi:hypothetical protein